MSYDMIDRFLRNNLGDDDYAEYSAALDSLCAPTKREWVGLKDEEIEDAWRDSCTIDNGKGANLTNQPFYHLVKLVEAKLKEKNT